MAKLHQMACGNCGGGDFTIHTKDEAASLFVKCKACASVSVIAPAAPRLSIEWGDNHGMKCEGVICDMTPTKK